MNMAKGAVQGGLDTSKAVLTGTKNTVSTGLTGAVNVAKGIAQTGLDTTKTVLTGTKDTVCSELTGAMNMAKGAVQGGLDTTTSMLMGTKDTMSTGLKGTVNVAKGAIQGSLDTTKMMLASTKDAASAGLAGAGKMATGAAHTSLSTIQKRLPGTQDTIWGGSTSCRATDKGGEHAALSPQEALSSGASSFSDPLGAGLQFSGEATAASRRLVSNVAMVTHGAAPVGQQGATSFVMLPDELEGLGEIFQPMSAEEQAQLAASEPGPKVLSADQRSYFVRLGDLAPSFRQRAFEHALSHMQHGQFQARDAVAQLQDSFRVIEKAMQAPEGQLHLDPGWNTSVEDTGTPEALARVCTLIWQLHTAYSGLASGLQGLPEHQRQVGRARHSLCDLYGIVSLAGSGEELPAERLAQSREGVGQAWHGLDQLLEGLQHCPPLGWLVGPFALAPSTQQV
ncbi:perilipin-4 [Heterocephalus glaber]|uniref:Perilipin-4 n=1 Tax=Heterocephalus glaber TaxID=10181 RepID=A0AAX6RYY8_HETGA|nr:perilipin-4 [Heterocephalus glaber]